MAAPPSSVLILDPYRPVQDVDEEVFLLWTLNTMPDKHAGLGYVSSSTDNLYVAIDKTEWSFSKSDRELSGDLVVMIHQDTTSLRSSKGNTGSVVWRSTVQLAIALRQAKLLNLEEFKTATVLELGSGTGALAALTAGLTKKWVATDQHELLPLIRRNLAHCQVEELDWNEYLRQPSPSLLARKLNSVLQHFDGAYPNVILCSDCVYNPALYHALTATLTDFTQLDHTIVLVVAEMRTDQGIADFLRTWRSSSPDWHILSLEDRIDKGFVAFAAWRSP